MLLARVCLEEGRHKEKAPIAPVQGGGERGRDDIMSTTLLEKERAVSVDIVALGREAVQDAEIKAADEIEAAKQRAQDLWQECEIEAFKRAHSIFIGIFHCTYQEAGAVLLMNRKPHADYPCANLHVVEFEMQDTKPQIALRCTLWYPYRKLCLKNGEWQADAALDSLKQSNTAIGFRVRYPSADSIERWSWVVITDDEDSGAAAFGEIIRDMEREKPLWCHAEEESREPTTERDLSADPLGLDAPDDIVVARTDAEYLGRHAFGSPVPGGCGDERE